jgi:Zn-dependent protease
LHRLRVPLSTDWGQAALLVGVVAPSIILHEVSHGVVANHFGDDTAKRAGRLTLNPLAHVDPVGTLLVPGLLALAGGAVFGWAKPVPVSVNRLRDPRQHTLFVSLAGPAVNVALAVLAAIVLRLAFRDDLAFAFGARDLPLVPRVLFYLGWVNVLLAVFNLLPIPPLDGSALVERALPASWWPTWLKLRQWGLAIIVLLTVYSSRFLDSFFDPALRLWARLL